MPPIRPFFFFFIFFFLSHSIHCSYGTRIRMQPELWRKQNHQKPKRKLHKVKNNTLILQCFRNRSLSYSGQQGKNHNTTTHVTISNKTNKTLAGERSNTGAPGRREGGDQGVGTTGWEVARGSQAGGGPGSRDGGVSPQGGHAVGETCRRCFYELC